MSGRHLVPCVACGRHVRAAETACPFCQAILAGSAPEPTLPSGRLSRAALVAFGLAVAGAACTNGNSSNNSGTITQGGSSGGEGASTGNGVDGDGGAPVSTDDGGAATDADAGAQPEDAGGVVALYGAPVARYGAPAPNNNGPGPIVTRYGAPALCDEV